MKLLLICFAALVVVRATTYSDSVSPLVPLVTASAYGPCFFTVLPDGNGAAYELKSDGSFHLLWRISGWNGYGTRAFLSQDGRYLVRLVVNPSGSQALEEEALKTPVLEFYARGKKIAQYTCAQLVKDRNQIIYSTSHYLWLANGEAESLRRPGQRPQEPSPVLNDNDHVFALKTVDGLVCQFDIRTGKTLFEQPDGKELK